MKKKTFMYTENVEKRTNWRTTNRTMVDSTKFTINNPLNVHANFFFFFQQYIAYSPNCQFNQTKKLFPYGTMRPIETPAIVFHIINIDLIFGLPINAAGFHYAMCITCKFNRKILLIPDKNTWDTPEWVNAFLTVITNSDCGIPRVMINDKNPKFMFSFWRTLFKKFGTKLLILTVFHFQTNGRKKNRSNCRNRVPVFYD